MQQEKRSKKINLGVARAIKKAGHPKTVAERVGLCRQYIYMLLDGQRNSRTAFAVISKNYNVNLGDFEKIIDIDCPGTRFSVLQYIKRDKEI